MKRTRNTNFLLANAFSNVAMSRLRFRTSRSIRNCIRCGIVFSCGFFLWFADGELYGQSGSSSRGSVRVANRDDAPQAKVTRPSAAIVGSITMDPNAGSKTDGAVEEFLPGQTLAIVGGYPVFVSDMSVELNQIINHYMAGAPPEIVEKQRPNFIRQLLPKYIDSKLMYVDVIRDLPKEADLEKIFESAGQQFDEGVLPMLMERAGIKSTAQMDTILREQGSSLRLMRKSWSENELTKYMTREKMDVDPEVTRQELLDYYRTNTGEFEKVARARWEEMMVRKSNFDNSTAAKKALAEMGNKIIHGAKFAAVAKKSSQGFNASSGGEYDWTVKGSLMSTEIDSAIFELPLNSLSEIIETDAGFHIIRITEREDAGFVPFVEAQTDIRKKLVEQKQNEMYEEHMEKLRKTIPIEILIEQEK